MTLPPPPALKQEDLPDVPSKLLVLLTSGFRNLYEALVNVPDTAEAVGRFVTSDGSGLATLDLRNELRVTPTHVVVTLLRNEASPDSVTAWGYTWRMAGTVVRVSFAGLAASTKYRVNMEYR